MELKPVNTVKETAQYIGCSSKTILKGISSGDINAFKIHKTAKQWYITDTEILKLTRGTN